MKRNSLYLYKTLGGTHGAPYAVITSDLDLQLHAGCCSREALETNYCVLNDSKRRSIEAMKIRTLQMHKSTRT